MRRKAKHRNAEIWQKRHEKLQQIERRNTANLSMALTASKADAARIHNAASAWAERYNAIERRVWRALCVAKQWRKA